MADPAKTVDQNILPVQALFNLDNSFNTFIGQGQPFFASINPVQSGLTITNSTIDSSVIGGITPSTGTFTNIATTTGTISGTPTNAADITNKQYVDQIAAGLSVKAPVLAATTANIALSGLITIDGVTLVSGNRVLVKNQTNTPDNGIYIAVSGAWSRSSDMSTYSQFPGAFCFVETGTTLADTGWVCTTDPGGTLGVTPITFVQFTGLSVYTAGTGLSLIANQFSITNTGVTANSYGSASQTLSATVNAQGQLTSLSAQSIAISASQITSGTIASSLISGNYSGITGVGTLASGTWNASLISPTYGGTGVSNPTGYLYGNGSGAATSSTTIPTTALSGTITNAQLANSTISGVSLGSNLFALTIGSGLTGTSYNGSAAVSITNSAPMVYPSSGIPNSTGSAWGTSYSVSGSGSVALTTGASLANPTVSNYSVYTPQSSLPTYAQGTLFYDQAQDALSYYNGVTNNELHIGQEVQLKVYNNTGSTINIGQPVYITSTSSGFSYPNVALAIANSVATSNVIGLANQAIPTGTAGYITTIGVISGINTGAYTVGDTLYLSPYSAGFYQNTIPPTGYAVKVGIVSYVNSSTGKIYVNKSNLYTSAGNIVGTVSVGNGGTGLATTPTNGQLLIGNGTNYSLSTLTAGSNISITNASGSVTIAASATSVSVTDDTTTNATEYPLFGTTTSGTLSGVYTSSTKYKYNPSTGILSATGFSGSGTSLTSLSASNINAGTLGIGYGGTGLTSTPTNGQLLIGNGTNYSLSTLTAGSGISITNGAGSISIASTGSGATITDDTTTNATRYVTFASATSGALSTIYTSSTKLKYNPSTGAMTASSIIIAP